MSHHTDVGSSELAATMAAASRWMKEGLRTLEGEPDHRAQSVALECFARATELRRSLPLERAPVFRYDLAACWLNRGEVLVRRCDLTSVLDAIAAYTEAIRLLRTLALEEDARFPRRLAIAHQNLGLALMRTSEAPRLQAAVAAFREAVAVLDAPCAAAILDRRHLRAVVMVNLAGAYAEHDTPAAWAKAHHVADQALEGVRETERHDGEAAGVALHARHVLCRALAATALSVHDAVEMDVVHRATDLVDDALALVREWEERGMVRFAPLAKEFLRFGARLYARFQPQFLDEFIAEFANTTDADLAVRREIATSYPIALKGPSRRKENT